MKFRNSEIPLVNGRRVIRARDNGNKIRAWWYLDDALHRTQERIRRIQERKRLLRAANRRLRRQLGLSFKNA